MRNYIILNGKNSNQINGLLIQELPPISKPLLRNQIEEIDGRDGDIVTPLGYSAYDKEFTIGLYKDFDVNEVAAYFNSEGTVIFSNEPDKYYYYQITAQIDFERLVRYRTATVTMHCQPFKYSATEQPITEDVSGTVSDEGTNIALENTAEAPFNTLDLKGNAYQQSYTGKNLANTYDMTEETNSGLTVTKGSDGAIILNGTQTAVCNIRIDETALFAGLVGEELTISVSTSGTGKWSNFGLKTPGASIITPANPTNPTITRTLTSSSTGKYYLDLYIQNNGTTFTDFKIYLQVEKSSTATPYEPYVGGTPSPNPDYPQPIQTVTGSQTVEIVGNNLFDGVFELGSISTTTGVDINDDNMIRSKNYAVIEGGENYTISVVGGGNVALRFYQSNGTFIGTGTTGASPNTFTAPVNAGRVRFIVTSRTNLSTKSQCEKGSSATTWNPYSKQTYTIDLGDIELCKLGEYQDYIWKDGVDWKIHKAVGKAELWKGTNWRRLNTNRTGEYRFSVKVSNSDIPTSSASNEYIHLDSTHWIACTRIQTYHQVKGVSTSSEADSEYESFIAYVDSLKTSDVDEWKAWLTANMPVVYYQSTTPTDTVITDQTLIEQLDDIYYHAHAYKGRTYIRSSSDTVNIPLVISAEVGEDNESTITNSGNYLSKPKIMVYGSGDISLYINDMHVLQITLGDEGYITIDTAQMEAYKDTLDNLKNRLVIGDYSNAHLKPGANKIHFTGKVTKYVVEDYSRWL